MEDENQPQTQDTSAQTPKEQTVPATPETPPTQPVVDESNPFDKFYEGNTPQTTNEQLTTETQPDTQSASLPDPESILPGRNLQANKIVTGIILFIVSVVIAVVGMYLIRDSALLSGFNF